MVNPQEVGRKCCVHVVACKLTHPFHKLVASARCAEHCARSLMWTCVLVLSGEQV